MPAQSKKKPAGKLRGLVRTAAKAYLGGALGGALGVTGASSVGGALKGAAAKGLGLTDLAGKVKDATGLTGLMSKLKTATGLTSLDKVTPELLEQLGVDDPELAQSISQAQERTAENPDLGGGAQLPPLMEGTDNYDRAASNMEPSEGAGIDTYDTKPVKPVAKIRPVETEQSDPVYDQSLNNSTGAKRPGFGKQLLAGFGDRLTRGFGKFSESLNAPYNQELKLQEQQQLSRLRREEDAARINADQAAKIRSNQEQRKYEVSQKEAEQQKKLGSIAGTLARRDFSNTSLNPDYYDQTSDETNKLATARLPGYRRQAEDILNLGGPDQFGNRGVSGLNAATIANQNQALIDQNKAQFIPDAVARAARLAAATEQADLTEQEQRQIALKELMPTVGLNARLGAERGIAGSQQAIQESALRQAELAPRIQFAQTPEGQMRQQAAYLSELNQLPDQQLNTALQRDLINKNLKERNWMTLNPGSTVFSPDNTDATYRAYRFPKSEGLDESTGYPGIVDESLTVIPRKKKTVNPLDPLQFR